ncbi:MAG: hybrid sensor histidine kinase/response regulator [Bacteroidales bacterium]
MLHNKQIRVLIAEDDFLLAQEIERTIRKMGYTCAGIASNGEMAVSMVPETKPDIILMDIKMPLMDGLEASRQIQEKYPTPVVALTAHESHDLIEEASKSGIGAYITKPLQPELIDRAVTIAMARHKDLMDSRALIKELEESKQMLSESIRIKDRFFSILAHDLRNPVAALMNFSDQIIRRAGQHSKEELVDQVRIIHDSSRNLFDLLENLLMWSRIQSRNLKPVPEVLNLAEIARHAILTESLHASNKEVVLHYHGENEVPAYADKAMIETVFRNLISNAVKFTGEKGTVMVIASVIDKKAEINIDDNGIGISPEILDSLFHPGHGNTTTGTMGEKGTGLGLVLCRELINSNGGEISVSSTPGQGTSIRFSLPLSL